MTLPAAIGDTISTVGSYLSGALTVAKDFAVQWGPHVVSTVHEGISGPVISEISSLFASAAPTMGPYAGPAIVGGAIFVAVVAASKLFNSSGIIAKLAGIALGVGAGVATVGAIGVGLGGATALAYVGGCAVTAASLLL